MLRKKKPYHLFFTFEEEEEIKTIRNEPVLVVPDGETNDPQEESPDQKQEESEGSPQTIFQG